MIVLHNTDGFSKLIYCASWSIGALTNDMFSIRCGIEVGGMLCFTYVVVIYNRQRLEAHASTV